MKILSMVLFMLILGFTVQAADAFCGRAARVEARQARRQNNSNSCNVPVQSTITSAPTHASGCASGSCSVQQSRGIFRR